MSLAGGLHGLPSGEQLQTLNDASCSGGCLGQHLLGPWGRGPGPARRLHPRAPRSALKQPPPRSPGRERAGEASAPGTEAAPSLPAVAGTRAATLLATSCSEGKSGEQRAAPGCCAKHAEARTPRQEGGRSPAAPPGRALGGPGGHPELRAPPAPPPHLPGLPRPSHPVRSLWLPSSKVALRGDRHPRSPGRSALPIPEPPAWDPPPPQGSQAPVTR